MEFYEPPLQPPRPGPSAQEMPPASSPAAVTATVTVSADDQEAQRAEARQRAERAPSTAIDIGLPQTEREDADPFNDLTASLEGVERARGDESPNGTNLSTSPYFAVLHVQVLGLTSTTSFPSPTPMTLMTVFQQSKSCYFRTARMQLGPLAPKVQFPRPPFPCMS